MTFDESIRTCFQKYAVFDGRASRSEFWWWMLFCFIASIALGVIDDRLSLAFTISTLLPSFAVTSRRLHDTQRSGWAQLIGLIPIIGFIIMIVWLSQKAPGEESG
ncbi:MAG TPA: DUF805 domain-containing protein [Aquabacterium sp.]|nr:DUF805 domain-containing protein [Aquabacterium sp.]